MRKVALGTTFYSYFNTRRFSTGAPFTLAGTPSMGLRRFNNATQITAGLTLTVDYDSITGYNEVAIVASTAGLVAGETYQLYIAAGTVDSVSAVGVVVDEFQVETATELAVRQLQEAFFPTATLGASASHSPTVIDMTGILPASTKADAIKGEILAISFTGETKAPELVRCTAQTATTLLATVEAIDDGGVMSSTPAALDLVWRVSQYTADIAKVSGTDVTWSATRGLAGTALPNAAADAAGGLPVSDAGGLDLDAKIGALTFTNAGEVNANTKSINDAEVVGDGNSTPWDGV